MKKALIALFALTVLGSSLHSMQWMRGKLAARKTKTLEKKLAQGIQDIKMYLDSSSRPEIYSKLRADKNTLETMVKNIASDGTPQDYLTVFESNEDLYGDLMEKLIVLQQKVEEADDEGGDVRYKDDPLVKFFEPLYQ